MQQSEGMNHRIERAAYLFCRAEEQSAPEIERRRVRGAAVTPANENLVSDAGRWDDKGGSLHATFEAAYAQNAAARTDASDGKAVG